MPTNTTDHQLRIKADARQVKNAGKVIKEAFSPRAVKDFGKEAQLVGKNIESLTKQQEKLNRALKDTRRGSEEYRRLTRELKDVERQAVAAERALRRIGGGGGGGGGRPRDPVTGQFIPGGGAGGGAGGGRPGRGSFWGGMAQGLGVAQYIPTGPGMASRIGGAALGGLMRRGVGAGAAPFLMPGIGGLSQMLGALPVVGGFAQGALSSAAGMYGQAAAYSRLRMQNLYLASPTMGQARQVENPTYVRAQMRLAAANAEVTRLVPLGNEIVRRQREAATAGPQTAGERAAGNLAIKGARMFGRLTGAPVPPEAGIRQLAAETARVAAKAAVGKLAGTTPDEELKGWATSAARATQERRLAEQQAKGIAKTVTATDRGLGSMALGVRYGMGPMQLEQARGAFFQARGGTWGARGAPQNLQFRESLAAQIRYGVGPQMAGAYARMGVAGGGGRGALDLSTTLQNAVTAGLRGAQIHEYLQSLVQLGRTAEQQGVKIDEREFAGTAQLMRGMGFRGPQVTRLTTGITQAGMELSQRGVQGARDMMLLRAAGFQPGGGRESYIRAMEKLEGGGGVGVAQNLLEMLGRGLEGVQGSTPEETARARRFYLRRAMGAMKMPIGSEMAGQILGQMEQGRFTPGTLAAIQERISIGQRGGAFERMDVEAQQRVRIGAPVAKGAAGIELGQIGAGQRMAGTIQALERIGIANVRILGNFNKQIMAVVGGMKALTTELEALTKGDLLSNIKDLVKRQGLPILTGMP